MKGALSLLVMFGFILGAMSQRIVAWMMSTPSEEPPRAFPVMLGETDANAIAAVLSSVATDEQREQVKALVLRADTAAAKFWRDKRARIQV